jgi:hypothetical protein
LTELILFNNKKIDNEPYIIRLTNFLNFWTRYLQKLVHLYPTITPESPVSPSLTAES